MDVIGECIEWGKAKTSEGYGLRYPGKSGTWLVHRQEWMKRNGAIPAGLLCLHKCNNPKCYNVDHLYLGTNKDNAEYKVACGRAKTNNGMRGKWGCSKNRGSKHGMAKLTEEAAVYIMARALTGKESHSAIAKDFSVCRELVSQVWQGKIWGHVFSSAEDVHRLPSEGAIESERVK